MCIPMLAAAVASAGSAAAAGGSFLAANSGLFSLLGAGVSAVGAYQQSQGQKQAAKYDAAVAAANAKTAEFKAEDAQDRALRDAETIGRQQAAMRGKQRAVMATNGLDLSSGTPQGLQDATDYYGLQDQKTAVDNGETEAWGLRTQRDNFNTEAQMQRNRAKSISPFGALATSLLGSASTISSRWAVKESSGSGNAWSFAK